MNDAPFFHFNAHAVGFAGQLSIPVEQAIDAVAPVALPPSGGYASARQENLRFREVIQIGAAYTQVIGSHSCCDGKDAWTEVAIATIENLSILGHVTADRITAVLNITHTADAERVFSVAGSGFENLRIGGEPVAVEFNHRIERWTEAVDAVNPKLSRERVKPGFTLRTSALATIRCSRLTEHNVIELPQFGRITLADYWITPYSRSLTMFRAEMGCGVKGRVEMAYVGGNGSQYPPPD